MRSTRHGANALSLLILLTAGFAGGCSGHRPPEVTVTGARLVETEGAANELRVDIELHNPNIEPLELMEFRYRVDADGASGFTGRRAARATVPPNSTIEFALPGIVTTAPDGYLAAWRVDGRLEYRSPGPLSRVLVDLGFPPEVSFRAKGDLTSP